MMKLNKIKVFYKSAFYLYFFYMTVSLLVTQSAVQSPHSSKSYEKWKSSLSTIDLFGRNSRKRV